MARQPKYTQMTFDSLEGAQDAGFGHAGSNPNSNPRKSFNFGGVLDNLFMPDGFFRGGSNNNNLKGFFAKAGRPQFDYNFKTGLQGWGKNLGGVATAIGGGIQGIQALQGLDSLSDARDMNEDLQSDIINASYNSPMLAYDLDPDQIALLNSLKRGTYDNSVDFEDIDAFGALGDTAMGVAMGAAGGIPGMVVGGVGGLANSILGDFNAGQERSNAELEALYEAILESERQTDALKKQRAYANLAMY